MQNEYIFKKDLYFVCRTIFYKTNIFCIKIYFSNDIYIFYIFIYVFLCKNFFFSVKKAFNVKLFFHMKTFFSVIYILSKTQIFFQKKFFATNEQPYRTTFKNSIIVKIINYVLKDNFYHCFPI